MPMSGSQAATYAAVVCVLVSSVASQEATPTPEGCYSAGSIAGAVIGTLLVTLALVAVAFAIWKFYWRSRRGKHLVLVTDAEVGADQYAFDNPCFRDGTPIGRTPPEKEPVKLDNKARWSAWSPIGALVGSRNEKRRALDDSFIGEPQVQMVSLRSHDFTGLGFNICGNMRDGIFVKDVLHRGPASESGRIAPGDRIDSIRISFRHMVFEDALTILSYASPYEVQLEVENAATSRPSTLIRTKRTSACSIAPADRICHPFYRSQSIADLAQIGKASLKRVQQMGGGINKSPHMSKSDPFDETAAGDYPTLKLSSSSPASTQHKKETSRLEKTAAGSSPPGSAVVKPERVKRATPKNSTDSPEESEGKADTLSRFQKFGVRVLPEPAVPRTISDGTELRHTMDPQQGIITGNHNARRPGGTEAERHQNEQNTMRERVGSSSLSNKPEIAVNPFSGHKTASDTTIDVVDGGRPIANSFFYDERGIDVGPIELKHGDSGAREHSGEETTQAGKQAPRTTPTDEESDSNRESNMKHLLSRGLQNLKEKLHHDRRKSSSSPESPRNIRDETNVIKKQKQGRHHTVSMSSDSEGVEADKLKESGTRSKIINPKDEPEKRAERRRQRNPDKDGSPDQIPLPPDEGIPTEIPEEVRRAAMAARNNRKSLGNSNMTTMPDLSKDNPDKGRSVSQESMSDSSSDCDVPLGIASDSLGRPPKRSNKRKAPPPPPEDAEDGKSSLTMVETGAWMSKDDDDVRNKDELEIDTKILNPWQSNVADTVEKDAIETVTWAKGTSGNPNSNITSNVQSTGKASSEPGRIITTFANMARQRTNPEPSGKDITNITIDDGSSHILSTFTSRRVTEGNENIPSQGNIFPVDSSSSGTSTMETKTVDYDEGVHVRNINSDSDSDLERLEGDDDGYEGKRNKKGGTTIELNSSHITIHHSPSSDTVQMADPDLESDSTRKAASLGDLSRLDSEQPMSILERAVSLDLADGGTPHGTKKRKAPPPPPGEEYLTTVQDGEEGSHYRKEPRLDNAMDTFQRRRLKKSSDWGTMEEALKQSKSSSNSYKIESTEETPRMDVDLSKFTESTSYIPEILKHKTDTLEMTGNEESKLSTVPQKLQEMPTITNITTDSVNITDILSLNARTKDIGHSLQTGRSSDVEIVDHSTMLSSKTNLPEESDRFVELGSNATVTKDTVQQQKTVLRISPEAVDEQLGSIASLGASSTTSQVTIVPTSSLIGSAIEFAEHERIVSAAQQQGDLTHSSEHHTTGIVSSTPLPNRDIVHSSEQHNSSAIVSSSPVLQRDQVYSRETVQSPLVTSSDAGISSINVVSSSTQDLSITPSELDSNILVTSATDPFVTAASMVDSTTTAVADTFSDDEATWGHDLQPPELPTSPVPVLNPAPSSSFNASPSMTYITEIQVVTTTDSENDHTIGSSNSENAPNGSTTDASNISSTFTQSVQKYRSDSSLSSDSIASDGDDKDVSATVPNAHHTMTNDNALGLPSRNNVTVTAIRTSALTGPTDRSKILTGTEIINSGHSAVTGSDNLLNHITEKKTKPARPPVPPRKSESSSSSMSSTITVEVPKIRPQQQMRLAETTSSSLLAGGSVSQGSPGSGKFISFSSLTPRSDSGSTRHSSSFEQWVFLDEASNGSKLNGLESSTSSGVGSEAGSGQHASVMTLPGTGASRTQTVTHIILDTKQNSGGQVKQ